MSKQHFEIVDRDRNFVACIDETDMQSALDVMSDTTEYVVVDHFDSTIVVETYTQPEGLSVHDIEKMLQRMFDVCLDDVDPDEQVRQVATFEHALVMTSDRGLVLSATDGSEFQITIVRSR